ncbi:hypothetical protein CC1G_06502 [Coprinopsis cinerea okayama7|uniref:DUF6533 domain-containing protein n=1 Tax=Coprinopsis cinerea (strain Okayama-7 / 130 / ATCC MYA-4618 / FGSC 9003) TaxID=240176 RepID=A8NNC4_COPC7|nr:hypothetical protein CC1G_06502 [Coprinopsis cinerea okayama7\|eukprot:XP_001835099.2 hypothetical protein CC1G_06502 [Coprinopsis cinerea okayama7\
MSGFRLLACAAPLTLEGLPACEKAMQLRRLQMTVQLISIVLLYYDYLLTLKDEIRYVWFGKFKPSTIYYICCRYSLAANVIYLYAILQDRYGTRYVFDPVHRTLCADRGPNRAKLSSSVHHLVRLEHLRPLRYHRLSGFLTARFILALRAAQAPNDDENSDGLPSFVANGNAVRVGGRSPIRFSTPVPSIFDEFQQDLGLGSERHSACDAVYVEHSSRNTLQKRREENPDIEEGFVQGCSRDFESASSSESPCRDVSSSSVVKQSSSAPEPSGVLGHTPTSAVWPDSASLRNRTKAGPSSSL